MIEVGDLVTYTDHKGDEQVARVTNASGPSVQVAWLDEFNGKVTEMKFWIPRHCVSECIRIKS